MFSVESVLRGYKSAQSEDAKDYRTVVGRELDLVLEMAVEGD
jgi:hypothetical protein